MLPLAHMLVVLSEGYPALLEAGRRPSICLRASTRPKRANCAQLLGSGFIHREAAAVVPLQWLDTGTVSNQRPRQGKAHVTEPQEGRRGPVIVAPDCVGAVATKSAPPRRRRTPCLAG